MTLRSTRDAAGMIFTHFESGGKEKKVRLSLFPKRSGRLQLSKLKYLFSIKASIQAFILIIHKITT